MKIMKTSRTEAKKQNKENNWYQQYTWHATGVAHRLKQHTLPLEVPIHPCGATKVCIETKVQYPVTGYPWMHVGAGSSSRSATCWNKSIAFLVVPHAKYLTSKIFFTFDSRFRHNYKSKELRGAQNPGNKVGMILVIKTPGFMEGIVQA